jgi:hypothetical protein
MKPTRADRTQSSPLTFDEFWRKYLPHSAGEAPAKQATPQEVGMRLANKAISDLATALKTTISPKRG